MVRIFFDSDELEFEWIEWIEWIEWRHLYYKTANPYSLMDNNLLIADGEIH
jgi:hypothetical protein